MALTEFNNSCNRLNCVTDVADKDELIAWAETIPLEELYDKIRELTGLTDLSFKHRITTSNPIRIRFQSQDLTDRVSVAKLMFATLRIAQLDSEVLVKNIKRVPTKLWQGTVCFFYKYQLGDRNITTFMGFKYIEGKGWSFTDYSSNV